MLPCVPVLKAQILDSNSGDIAGQRRDGRASQTAVIPCKEKSSDQAVKYEKTHGDIDVYLCVFDRQMHK